MSQPSFCPAFGKAPVSIVFRYICSGISGRPHSHPPCRNQTEPLQLYYVADFWCTVIGTLQGSSCRLLWGGLSAVRVFRLFESPLCNRHKIYFDFSSHADRPGQRIAGSGRTPSKSPPRPVPPAPASRTSERFPTTLPALYSATQPVI